MATDLHDPVVARLGRAIDPPGRLSRAKAWPGGLARRAGEWGIESWVSLAIVAACVAFVFGQLGPANVLSSSTPAGGDMGAHVWGPAYLRDHLLPSFRLTGWTPDWYAGFPAYQFYMVLPSLAIALLSFVMPYGVAFKLVAISGVVSLPVACWAFGRLTRLPFPAPPLLAVAATAFLFDRSFSIYGGNIASTLAGEFAFSISLTFAVLFLGVVGRGMETGRHRALAAGLLALTGLCHLIPFLFAIAGAGAWLLVSFFCRPAPLAALARQPDGDQTPAGGPRGLVDTAAAAVVVAARWVASLVRPGFVKRTWWMVGAGGVGVALAAWWLVPFYLRSAYLNDMGWEKKTTYLDLLFHRENLDTQLRDAPPILWILVLAALGVVMSVAWRRRAGAFLVVMGAVAALGFRFMPQGRLWNARLLPFWYLCLYLLAAIGVAELGRTVATLMARDPAHPRRSITIVTAVAASLVAIIALALPLRAMPESIGIGPVTVDLGGVRDDGAYHWMFLSTTDSSFVPSWARWNFTGYEGKPAYPEYHDIVATMAGLGQQQGCGRAMWEHEEQHDRYGTPMALMLLPFWTDGCIGSMEGLYFEASATTPYHFLNQDELSTGPSNAQRGLPYEPGPPTLEQFDLGIEHLQMFGVKYYMAISDGMIAQGRANPEPQRGGVLRAVGGVRGGGQPAGATARPRPGGAHRRLPARLARRGDTLVPRLLAVGRLPRRRGTQRVATQPRCGLHRQRADHAGGRHRRHRRHRHHPLRCQPGGHPGAGQGVLLPELEGERGRWPLAGRPQPDGRGADGDQRRAELRHHLGRVARLGDHRSRDRGAGAADPAGPSRPAPGPGLVRRWRRRPRGRRCVARRPLPPFRPLCHDRGRGG